MISPCEYCLQVTKFNRTNLSSEDWEEEQLQKPIQLTFVVFFFYVVGTEPHWDIFIMTLLHFFSL